MSIVKNKEIYDPSQGDPFKDIKKYLGELDKVADKLVSKLKSLEVGLRAIEKTDSGKEAKALADGITQITKETDNLNKVNKTRNDITDKITKAEQALVKLYDSESQQLAEVKVEIQQRNRELKQLVTQNKFAADSVKGLSVQLIQLRDKYDKLSKKERENEQVGGKLLKNIQALDEEYKQLKFSSGRFQDQVGKYPKQFGSANTSLKGLLGSLKGLGSQLLGAAGITGGVTAVIAAFSAFAEKGKQLIDLNRKIENTFNIGGASARKYSNDILAIANNFDVDFNEVLTAANAVSKQLDISLGDALANIEEGFKKGSNNTGQFLDILKEYSPQFKAAGIDAQTTFAIINQQVKAGIYSDKGVDAIKEGGLRLRENTKAVKEALAPLDESVKLQIQQEIAAGNSFKAIQLVSNELKNTSLTAAQTQTIIADVFGGAGEDAGLAYLQTLADIKTNLEDVQNQTTQNEDANLKLSKSWNNFTNSVFASGSIITKVWASLKEGVGFLIDDITFLLEKVGLGAGSAGAGAKALGKTAKDTKKDVDELTLASQRLTNSQGDLVDGFGNVIKTASQLKTEYQAAKRAVEELQDKQIKQTEKSLELATERAEEQAGLDEKEQERQDELVEREFERLEEKLTKENEIKLEFQDKELAEKAELEKKKAELDEQFAGKAKQVLASTAEYSGQVLGELIFNAENSTKSLAKSLTLIALQALRNFLTLTIARIFLKETSEKSFAGIATAALLTGLVTAAYTTAKSALELAEGTENVNGPGTETSDSIPAMLSKNERVVPARINKQLNGIKNDDLPGLINAGLGNIELANLLVENNRINSRMLESINRLGYVYEQDGYIVEKPANGSKINKFPKNTK